MLDSNHSKFSYNVSLHAQEHVSLQGSQVALNFGTIVTVCTGQLRDEVISDVVCYVSIVVVRG